jgi:lipoprotein-releasing system permease protein
VFFLAMKQLFSRKTQTLLILLGVSFGTMLFVSISGVQLGFREYIIKALLNNTAHVIISGAENEITEHQVRSRLFSKDTFIHWITPPSGKRDESKLESYLGWVDFLRESPDVYDFSPRLTTNVILKNSKLKTNVSLVGSLPEKQLRISDIADYMAEGSFEALSSGGNKIVLGIGVGKDLGLRVGQYVDVLGADGRITPFKIVGFSKFGDDRTDAQLAFAHLSDVQKVNRTPGRLTEIAVALTDIEKSEELAQFWSSFNNDKVEGWRSANARFMEMIRMQDIVRYFIMFSVLVVAAFGIYNVLTIMINQKRHEIAILRSIGYPPYKILELILYQGFFMGLLGGVVGLLLGASVTYLVSLIDIGVELGGSNTLLVSYDSSIYVSGFVAALFASFVASVLPAYLASQMTPIDIIRGVR